MHPITNNANTNYVFNHPVLNYFHKGDVSVTITLEHFRVIDGLVVNSSVGLPHSVYFFDIKGVE
jgi:hypothetical protein